jgi:hypothetical protein
VVNRQEEVRRLSPSQSEVHFEETGPPKLVAPDQEIPSSPGESYVEQRQQAQEMVQVGWTPLGASQFVASILTTGLVIAYVARQWSLPSPETEWPVLVVRPGELSQTGLAMVPVLDRWLPKGEGGEAAQMLASITGAVGEVGLVVVQRLPTIVTKKEPPVKPRYAQEAAAQAAADPHETPLPNIDPNFKFRADEVPQVVPGFGF